MPVQVDGEPWVQSPGEVSILKSALKVLHWLNNYYKGSKLTTFLFAGDDAAQVKDEAPKYGAVSGRGRRGAGWQRQQW